MVGRILSLEFRVQGLSGEWGISFVNAKRKAAHLDFCRNRRNSAFVSRVRSSHCVTDDAQNSVFSSLCSEDPIVKWNHLPMLDLTAREVLPEDNLFVVWRLFRPG